MRSVLSRYLLPISCNGVRHTTLNVPVCQIFKFVVMPSLNYGDVSNLVLQKAWQQDTDVIHNERSKQWRFFFDNLQILLACGLPFSPWRMIVGSLLQVN